MKGNNEIRGNARYDEVRFTDLQYAGNCGVKGRKKQRKRKQMFIILSYDGSRR